MARLWAALAGDDDIGDRRVGEEGDSHPCDVRTNELTPQVGHRRPALGVSSFVRRPTAPDTAASPLPPPPLSPLPVSEWGGRFLEWLQSHRSRRTHYERSRHLLRFADASGTMDATAVTGAHLES